MSRGSRLSSFGDWWRVTLASIGDAVIATDTSGGVVFLNPIAESLTGWTQAEAEGRCLDDVFVIVGESTGARVENPVHKVRLVLEKCNAEVKDAASADEALRIAGQWNASIVVSDIGMPGADGYQFIQLFRECERQRGTWTPAVALTAYARTEDACVPWLPVIKYTSPNR